MGHRYHFQFTPSGAGFNSHHSEDVSYDSTRIALLRVRVGGVKLFVVLAEWQVSTTINLLLLFLTR